MTNFTATSYDPRHASNYSSKWIRPPVQGSAQYARTIRSRITTTGSYAKLSRQLPASLRGNGRSMTDIGGNE